MLKKKIYMSIILVLLYFLMHINLNANCIFISDTITERIYFQGCYIEYVYYGCIDNFGLHHIFILEINVYPPCDSTIFEKNIGEVKDSIMLEISLSNLVSNKWNLQIPPCDSSELCLIFHYKVICYTWYFNDNEEKYKMRECIDNEYRNCEEVALICWYIENGEIKYRIRRQTFYDGPPCPPGCNTNCGR